MEVPWEEQLWGSHGRGSCGGPMGGAAVGVPWEELLQGGGSLWSCTVRIRSQCRRADPLPHPGGTSGTKTEARTRPMGGTKGQIDQVTL